MSANEKFQPPPQSDSEKEFWQLANERPWTEAEQRGFEFSVDQYIHALELKTSFPDTLPLPEDFRKEFIPFCVRVQRDVQADVKQANFNMALRRIKSALHQSAEAGFGTYINAFLYQLEGNVYLQIVNTISQTTQSESGKKYWTVAAIQKLMLAHRYDQFASDDIRSNPILIQKLMIDIGESEQAKKIQG